MSLTASQARAVEARGNVLVIAGAGTGKTRTLVDRALSCLLNDSPQVSLNEILMVTFTEAAAAEMRHRIRAELERRASEAPHRAWCNEQLAMFDAAPIGTLHSFCLRLIRQHFYRLELDPEFSILSEEEAHLLQQETLEELLDQHYRGRADLSRQVQELIELHGRSTDVPVGKLVLRLHNYTQTLPDPAGWFRDQAAVLASPEPATWHRWLMEGFHELRRDAADALSVVRSSNLIAATCLELLEKLTEQTTRGEAAQVAVEILRAFEAYPRGKKSDWVEPHEHLLDRFRFLECLLRQDDAQDPLAQDWQWMRGPASTLLQLTSQYSSLFARRKRDLGVVDFHDLEQHALTLLLNPATLEPTDVAREWQSKLRHVFVDEYQDINGAQDQIIRCLSRPGDQANRFLVGDVKQSIYRFRLANPYIFQGYSQEWRRHGTVIALQENFRSRPEILDFVNSVFGELMRAELGGVAYDAEAVLKPGLAGVSTGDGGFRVELHWRMRSRRGTQTVSLDDPAGKELEDLEEAAKEARLVCARVRSLVESGYAIYDPQIAQHRPVQWHDIALLLRSAKVKSECYAKEFARQNVPLVVAKGGFYDSLEVLDVLSLLQIIDNPLQDIPLLAVLRSPFVALTNEELAAVRLHRKGRFWEALRACASAGTKRNGDQALAGKVQKFLAAYRRWRRLAREVSLCRCLQTVLAETHYEAWLSAQPRGEQRRGNVQRLLALARKFDAFQRQGLFRFLRFIEAQQEADAEPPVSVNTAQNAVRVMSIHQSKGLEFPVVVLADLGKRFNIDDLKAGIILDEQYGICPQIRSPSTGRMYSSLSHWLAKHRQAAELRAEELRVLYVAMTRARDLLILSGTLSQKQRDDFAKPLQRVPLDDIRRASTYSDWLARWFGLQCGESATTQSEGERGNVRWKIWDDEQLLAAEALTPAVETPLTQAKPAENAAQLLERMAWDYRYEQATSTPAKTTVTTLRRELARDADDDAHLAFVQTGWPEHSAKPTGATSKNGSAADVGTSYHKFLQLADLEKLDSNSGLQAEAARLTELGMMSAEQIEQIDFEALAEFWRSEIGAALRAYPERIKRELAFTVRFDLRDLAMVGGRPPQPLVDGDFVVVQGVVDLVAFMPDGLWVLDFKTDSVPPAGVGERVIRYEPQVRAYAAALAKVYRTPVANAWLYFTGPRHLAAVDVKPLAGAASSA